MPCCVAVNCSNRHESGFVLYRFPRNVERRAVWALKVKRGNWKPTDSSYLCEILVGNVAQNQVRFRSGLPFNTVVLFVPQQEAWIVERFGKFNRVLEPGLNFCIPVVDSIKYVQSLKEIAIDIPQQSAITADNVNINIDGVLYLRVVDPYKASYGVEDAEYAITQLAQTTMRSEIGKITLDTVFRERELLNTAIVYSINKAADSWGLDCKRYEIRDMRLPMRVQEAMQMQVEAERKKRAAILESEGIREADINVAEGKKQARILTSEAYKLEQVNQARGEAEAILATANAKAEAIAAIASALTRRNGHHAVSLRVAEQYIAAFSNLAKTGNTVLLPTNTGDVSSMVTQAMAIYNTMNVRKPAEEADNNSTNDETDEDVLRYIASHKDKHGETLTADSHDSALAKYTSETWKTPTERS